MKDQKKNKVPEIKKAFGMEFTMDEALNKYLGPEFEPPKLKDIQKKFAKRIVEH